MMYVLSIRTRLNMQPRNYYAVICSVASVCLSACLSVLALRALTFESLHVKPSVLARDAFVRTNRRAIAIMFVRLSVWDGRAL